MPEKVVSPALKYHEAHPLRYAAGVAEMDFGTSPAVTDSLLEAVKGGQIGYLDSPLSEMVARRCASWMSREYGWKVDPAWIRLAPDSASAILAAQGLFAGDSDTLVYTPPLYGRLWSRAEAFGLKTVPVALQVVAGHYAYDLEGIDRAFSTAHNPIFVLCNPHNPTGFVASRKELETLSGLVHRHKGLVISDEVHAPLTFSGSTHVPYASVSDEAQLHSVTIVSTSKGWNTSGMKCAQIVIGNDLHRRLWDGSWKVEAMANSTSRLGAIAAGAAYADKSEWRAMVVDALERNVSELYSWTRRIKTFSMLRPQASFLAWISMDAVGNSAMSAGEFFRSAGIYVQEGSVFDPGDGRHVRLNYALHHETLIAMLNSASAISNTLTRTTSHNYLPGEAKRD